MKLSNIFKKSTKKVAKANIETLAKNQLEKVIGGAGPDVPLQTNQQVVKSKSNVKNN
jgi:hypothetical protein